jgi:hypothetical protein
MVGGNVGEGTGTPDSTKEEETVVVGGKVAVDPPPGDAAGEGVADDDSLSIYRNPKVIPNASNQKQQQPVMRKSCNVRSFNVSASVFAGGVGLSSGTVLSDGGGCSANAVVEGPFSSSNPPLSLGPTVSSRLSKPEY